jgi:hypothetical protein
MLIFGIDKFMPECRALVNFFGNAVATRTVAKWENGLDLERARAVLAGKTAEPPLTAMDEAMDEAEGEAKAEDEAEVRGQDRRRVRGRPAGRGVACRSDRRGGAVMTSVLIAPDKFKGSLTGDEVARALERGLQEAAPHARVSRLALAEGGEGSVAAPCSGRCRREEVVVTGPTGAPPRGRCRGAQPYRPHRGCGRVRTRRPARRAQAIAHGHQPGRRPGDPVRAGGRGGHDRPRPRRGGHHRRRCGDAAVLGAVLADEDGMPIGRVGGHWPSCTPSTSPMPAPRWKASTWCSPPTWTTRCSG